MQPQQFQFYTKDSATISPVLSEMLRASWVDGKAQGLVLGAVIGACLALGIVLLLLETIQA